VNQRARAVNRDEKSWLTNLFFGCVVNNDTWMRLCLPGQRPPRLGPAQHLHRAPRPGHHQTIRHRLLSIAGRLTPTGRRLHLDSRWPSAIQVLEAITRLPATFRPHTVTRPHAP
jgi:hypothetical protein